MENPRKSSRNSWASLLKVNTADKESQEVSGSQFDFVKYPTFDDITIEDQLKHEITLHGLLIDLRTCDEELKAFSSLYDKLLLENTLGADIQKLFVDNKMNNMSYKIYSMILLRQITLFYYLIQKKISKNEVDREQYKKSIQENYIDADPSRIIENFVEENQRYFDGHQLTNSENEARKNTIELLETLFKKEKALIEFDTEAGDNFVPSKVSINLCVKMLMSILEQVITDIKTISAYQNTKSIKEENLVAFFNNLTKMEIFSTFFLLCYKIPSDNVFNLPEDGETWVNMKKHFDRVMVYSRHVIKKKLQKVFDAVILGNASISKCYNQFSSRYLRVASAGWYMAYFFFNKKKAKTQSMRFLMHPDNEIAQTIWNLMDSKGIKSIIKIGMPRIAYSRKWFLKRLRTEITIDSLKDILLNRGIIAKAKKDEKLKLSENALYNNDLIDPFIKEHDQESQSSTSFKDLIVRAKTKDPNSYVKVRILSHQQFYIQNQKSLLRYLCCCSSERNSTRNSLIIHIHGGGFIAMSASSHENYTRKWVNALAVPLISIDYRLAPDHPFPKGLEDVYQAYMWIITYASTMFKMNLEKIILVGDSAGGNLVLGLTYLLILLKVRLPTALFLAYPALRVSLKEMSCSYLNVLTDQILPYHLLKFCNDSYKRVYDNDHDPFVSPLYMDDAVLKQLPPVRIFAGSSDPLRDDSILFLRRLVELNNDVQMTELKYFPHGFLNYDYNLLMPEAAVANDMIIEEMEKFIA